MYSLFSIEIILAGVDFAKGMACRALIGIPGFCMSVFHVEIKNS